MAVKFQDNSPAVLAAFSQACYRLMEIIGLKAERYAKKLCPVGTEESTGKKGYRGGTLRNSITHTISRAGSAIRLVVGTNIVYGPYVELGTGPYFEPPPEWEKFDSRPGSGIGHSYVHPRPFIRPAILDHRDEYKEIAERELKNTKL